MVGIWSRDLSVPGIDITAKRVRTDVGEGGDVKCSAGTVVGEVREFVEGDRQKVFLDDAPARTGVGAEPGSVSGRTIRDIVKVTVSVGGISQGIGGSSVDL